MPLTPGTTLGPYEVDSAIGEGGMGEVYQARDTKLDRDVALKVLPEAFTADPERLARFEREATGMSASGPRHAESDTEALTAVTGLRMMLPMRDVAPRCWRRSTALGP